MRIPARPPTQLMTGRNPYPTSRPCAPHRQTCLAPRLPEAALWVRRAGHESEVVPPAAVTTRSFPPPLRSHRRRMFLSRLKQLTTQRLRSFQSRLYVPLLQEIYCTAFRQLYINVPSSEK